MRCKWCDDFSGVCTNGDCPACADCCPCFYYPEICKHADIHADIVVDDDGSAKV